ncbi:MAG: hypothetical protein HYV29_10255 [Ignavibacteriales bacterium]|nr:hypothetical protein [Ignavibacteriales bacterium]
MNARYQFFVCIVLLAGCIDDAPHDNPLDPSSPAYVRVGSMTGVITIANQSTAIAGATITDLDENILVRSDTFGYFVFNHLSSGTHTFVCTKENFTNDTFRVDIQDRASTHVVRGLNGAPVVVSQNILARKIDQYFPSPQYFVEVTAEVIDPNSSLDLDSVWFSVVDTLRFPLAPIPGTNNFITTIYKNKLPTNTIQWLVGKPLYIVSRDDNGAVNIGSPFFVTRVIEQTANPLYPSSLNNDTTTVFPEFRWDPPDVTFNYSYTLSLSRIDGGTQTIVWMKEGISSIDQSLQYPNDGSVDSLQQGTHVWSISVVDDFGNYARSKESSFVVK